MSKLPHLAEWRISVVKNIFRAKGHIQILGVCTEYAKQYPKMWLTNIKSKMRWLFVELFGMHNYGQEFKEMCAQAVYPKAQFSGKTPAEVFMH